MYVSIATFPKFSCEVGKCESHKALRVILRLSIQCHSRWPKTELIDTPILRLKVHANVRGLSCEPEYSLGYDV